MREILRRYIVLHINRLSVDLNSIGLLYHVKGAAYIKK
nr:MAG TPA: hypothetical protein [Caudoviricetes sp.]